VDYVRFTEKAFVKISKREAWLCHCVAGKARGLDPLARTKVLDELIKGCANGGGRDDAPADPMAALGLDDDPVGEAALPMRASKKSNVVVYDLSVKSPLVKGQFHIVRCLSRPPGKPLPRGTVYVMSDDLPWVIHALTHEVQAGGVEYEPEDTTLRQPYWMPKVSAWRVRAKLPDGTVLRRQISVPRIVAQDLGCKRSLSDSEFRRSKEAKLLERCAWRDDVEAGRI